MRAMARLGVALLLLGGLLCGCDPDVVATPTPAQLAARVYVLAPRQVPGYQRGTDMRITPKTLADQDRDPALVGRLRGDGWRDGALDIYSPPANSAQALPFLTLSSQAVIFDSGAGAHSFYAEEQKRIDVAPAKGTITNLAGVPANSIDEIVAYVATQPPANPTEGQQQAFVALIRKGQVVVELGGFAGADAVSPAAFIALIVAEEELMQVQPQ